MPDASSTSSSDAEDPAASDGGTDVGETAASDGGTDSVDDRPERPPSARLIDALGVVDHAKRGLVVGLALAAVVFGFFVVLPLVDPGTPARAESPLLYLALAFVAATAATLLVASALAVRAVAGRVMAYAKWVRRGAVASAVGGAWWAVTGVLAIGIATETGVPASAEPLVLVTLPLPVLVLAVGAWSALARSGATEADATDGDAFDHVHARPRVANVGAALALAGIAAVHTATFLQTDAFLGTVPGNVAGSGFLVGGALALAAGTAALALAVHRTTDARALTTGASALAGASVGLAGLVATEPLLTAIAVLVLPGLAWLALGVAIARDPGTYPERPV